MSPGPNTTASAPSAVSCGASVPKATVDGVFPDWPARKGTTSEPSAVDTPRSSLNTRTSAWKPGSSASSRRTSAFSSSGTRSTGWPGIGLHSSVKRQLPAITFFALPPEMRPTFVVV